MISKSEILLSPKIMYHLLIIETLALLNLIITAGKYREILCSFKTNLKINSIKESLVKR